MIGVVQPGLSMSTPKQKLALDPVPQSAQQVSELLTVWHDAVSTVTTLTIIASN
jgi:hypothetical protein